MLDEATNAARELHALLRHQLAEVPAARARLAGLDPEGVYAWAAAREAENGKTLHLERRLLEALTAACGDAPDATLDTLRARMPREMAALDGTLAELRALATELRREDALTREALDRSRACVRSYLSLLSPKASAYDRRGQATATEPLSSRRVSV